MRSVGQNLEKLGLRDVFLNFLKSEAFGGVFLFFAAVLAMIIANSSLSEMYFNFWHMELGVEVQGLAHAFPFLAHLGAQGENGSIFIGFSMHHWISDVLMALFFLMVGLEIKREVLFGELASVKKAIFPALAAVGGMLVPGLIYFGLNAGTPSVRGFGIPMATDIAFALGVIMLLKSRVPMALKVFLVTLAVVDDLGAIVVIALFYTSTLHYAYLGLAGVLICALIILNKLGIKSLSPYLCVGVVLWFAVHNSGIHATISAVVLAFCIPVRPKFDLQDFNPHVTAMVDRFVRSKSDDQVFLNESQVKNLRNMSETITMVQSPLGRLERALHPWSAYCIMPLFGFANAGVRLDNGVDFSTLLGFDHIFLGVVLGLLIGKPVGIFLITFLCEKFGIAARPSGITWGEILGAGMLAGIGFTMSIFVSDLAFKGAEHAEQAAEISKIAILSGSLISGIIGALFLLVVAKIKDKVNK
ncbi:Na+/H+ antiporter NhaA [Helicobacter sp.]|uniref:Na+/H+ antiporter NhaA n=1 Tax=Helicobacter sp. TaxID=218 RepID=UPI0025B7C1CF|nr:Na+/H+ antiporter NhaA [Helicobacter sp.]MBR2495480.1 Na+/H+ antiporter NhaA [Helicobacter sp.]